MMDVKYFVDGEEVTPFNHKELSVELNFDKDSPDSKVLLNKWRFTNESADIVYKKYLAGLTGGTGIFEGIPFKISVSDNGVNREFNQYLDLTTVDALLSCDDIECESRDAGNVDWLNTVADSFTFEYLNEQTPFLPDSKFISVPYILNSVPNYKEVMIISITMVFTIQQLNLMLSDFAGTLSAIANPFASPSEAVKAAFRILYTITLLITLIKLISDLIDMIIQPVKYHKGMYVRDLIDSACAYLGLTFESSIIKQGTFYDSFIIPRKFDSPVDTFGKKIVQKELGMFGFILPSNEQKGYFEGTFGDLLRAMKTIYKGKIIIKDGVLRLEREDYNNSSASYIIPDIYSPSFKTNANELNSNYLIEFQTDVNDKNSINDFTGNIVRVYTAPNLVVNKDMLLTQGYNQQAIPFALARRKEDLTVPEKILNVLLKIATAIINPLIVVVNGIISVINLVAKAINSLKNVLNLIGIKLVIKIPPIKKINAVDFGAIVNDRIGMLMIENDSILTPKIMLLSLGSNYRQNKIYSTNKSIFNAKYLYDNFHYIQSFVPVGGVHNQYIRKSIQNVPFCFDDYEKVLNDNKIYTSDGKIARIENLKWNIWDQVADIDYRYNELYTNNLIQSTYESKGY